MACAPRWLVKMKEQYIFTFRAFLLHIILFIHSLVLYMCGQMSTWHSGTTKWLKALQCATSASLMNFSFHEIYIKALITQFCCALALPKRSCFCLGTALSIVKIHLLLNRFGESCNQVVCNRCSKVAAWVRKRHSEGDRGRERHLFFPLLPLFFLVYGFSWRFYIWK